MIEQLGEGWSTHVWPKDPTDKPFGAGLTAAFAVDPEQKIFAHIATGEDMMHVRRYTTMDRLSDGYIRFDAPDGTVYFFNRDLNSHEQALMHLWDAGASNRAEDAGAVSEFYMQARTASDYAPLED